MTGLELLAILQSVPTEELNKKLAVYDCGTGRTLYLTDVSIPDAVIDTLDETSAVLFTKD